jgi:ubiquinone/menaquinone biosynthesis C-methylase UbiE
MNKFENWFCGSAYWRHVTRRELLPWLLEGAELGEHVLELGAGPGAATLELAGLAPRVTSLEYDHNSVKKLRARACDSHAQVIQGDASALPFADQSFSSAIAILMLHHMESGESQDRALAEIFRVLRPGGIFLAFEIPNRWFHRLGHIKSTFVPLNPSSSPVRLAVAGFSQVTVDFWRGNFRIRGLRSKEV